ncbi:MAG: electron transfer flavoprotein subunit alpha/FixB family protein, partial [Bacteroidia bacterium]|nr:electron transfer flavoprotein subunit alpha/FixB family protein [Bacteroidia bacterium]
MSIVVYTESDQGRFKKAAFEAVHYGHLTAQSLGGACIALVIGAADAPESLGIYGASKVIHIANYEGGFESAAYAQITS